MAETRAQRTLVKSPPELWAEVSDVTALARHLGEFGEIRITRLEPETTVAWEGDTARGTVELQASGWGTKVTLTAEIVADAPAAPTPEPEPVVANVAEPVVCEDEPTLTEPEPEPVTVEPVAVEPEPAPPVKLGFFARLFGRKSAPVVASVAKPVVCEDEPTLAVAPAPEPVVAPEPELVPDEPEAPAGELRAGEPVDGRALDEDAAVAVLTAVLDDLGSAHHRPFSRS